MKPQKDPKYNTWNERAKINKKKTNRKATSLKDKYHANNQNHKKFNQGTEMASHKLHCGTQFHRDEGNCASCSLY